MIYKTETDLNQAIETNKPESVIRSFWESMKKGEAYDLFVNGNDEVGTNGNKINKSRQNR